MGLLNQFGLATAALLFILAGALASSASAVVPPEGSPANGDSIGGLAENPSTGAIEGTYISLQAPAAGDIVANFSLEGALVFSRVAVTDYAKEEMSLRGAQVQLTGGGARLQAHDLSSGTISLRLDAGASAVFFLGPAVAAAPGENGSAELTWPATTQTAALWSTCADAATAFDAAARTYSAHATASCTLNFRARAAQASPAAHENAIDEAVESGKVDVEVSIQNASHGGADVTSYAEANVIVAHVDGRVVVSIDMVEEGPTSVLIRFPAAGENGPILVTIDGRTIQAVASVEEALAIADQGGEGRVAVDPVGGEGFIVVSLQSAGSHVVEIQSSSAAPAAATAQVWLGLASALALTAVAGLLLFRRR